MCAEVTGNQIEPSESSYLISNSDLQVLDVEDT
jgi:hypothetical protein